VGPSMLRSGQSSSHGLNLVTIATMHSTASAPSISKRRKPHERFRSVLGFRTLLLAAPQVSAGHDEALVRRLREGFGDLHSIKLSSVGDHLIKRVTLNVVQAAEIVLARH
jgi:aspartate-semialdehyde dehydrogenase